MREQLKRWVNDADALHNVLRFGSTQIPTELHYVSTRQDDFYFSLVGELFDSLNKPFEDSVTWSRLGNAIIQLGVNNAHESTHSNLGIIPLEVALYAAAAFYFGGYPASAYLALKSADSNELKSYSLACYELLARPVAIRSEMVRRLIHAVNSGNLEVIREATEETEEQELKTLQIGPTEWVSCRLFRSMLSRFSRTNIRAVLPDGENEFWNPLVKSLLKRKPPVWDFFPSQIDAIESGFLDSASTYSIQMPTGAGKTALSETLLFYHLKTHPIDVAVLLVPYRSLASELRGTLVRNLNRMGFNARCFYGGTVPISDEVRGWQSIRAIVATPEALSGVLNAYPELFRRISLVICDEGHLLDGRSRGVGLELLLTRMLVRESGSPKFTFISAIVPNIEEINAWLGGSADTVLRSNYRPALAEFGVLRSRKSGRSTTVDLLLHPQEKDEAQYSIENFLSRGDFRYIKQETGRQNTYPFSSIKTRAIATARKALAMGAVAVFAANKRGNSGAVGLAQELLKQLELTLPLPTPLEYVSDEARVQHVVEHLSHEYGAAWIGTLALKAGAVLHHGDIPQESREVVETLVREEVVRVAICTNTLAEGVNLPIRTLVLYSVRRRRPDGAVENLLARDIKNLVGRAGRAGITTKGLVICANEEQWYLIEPVAKLEAGERVIGALHKLMVILRRTLSQRGLSLTNEILESAPMCHTLIDGIDATLIDLAAEELGEIELTRIANELGGKTFAARSAESETMEMMREVFELRARLKIMSAFGRIDRTCYSCRKTIPATNHV